MLTFREFLVEYLKLQDRILKNPSSRTAEAQLKGTTYKELRYLMHRPSGNVWTGDASRVTHEGIFRDTEHFNEKNHYPHGWAHDFHLGVLEQKHINEIKRHPEGIKGWIKDRHNKLSALMKARKD